MKRESYQLYVNQRYYERKKPASFLLKGKQAIRFASGSFTYDQFYVYNINRYLFLHFMKYRRNLTQKGLIPIGLLEVYNPFEM